MARADDRGWVDNVASAWGCGATPGSLANSAGEEPWLCSGPERGGRGLEREPVLRFLLGENPLHHSLSA